jgi:hypothetical protein
MRALIIFHFKEIRKQLFTVILAFKFNTIPSVRIRQKDLDSLVASKPANGHKYPK